jgi:prefoldin subunit 5
MTDPQPRGAIYWARKQAVEREAQRAAGRPSAATTTQQQLDALYSELDQLREDLAEEQNTSARRKRILDRRRPELENAEATVERVREEAQWLRRNYPGLTQLHSRLDAALDPSAHDTGPSVAECAQADRRRPLEKHGE